MEYPDYSEVKKMEYYNLYEDIVALQNDKKTSSVPQLKTKYKHIQLEYPDLFKRVLREDLSEVDFNLLKIMLDTREKLRNKEIESKDAIELIATENAKIYMPYILKKPE